MSDEQHSREREFLEALGAEFRSWRERRGYSRPGLAALTKAKRPPGLSKETVGRIERGETSYSTQATWELADALGVKLSDLVRRAEDAIRMDDPPGEGRSAG